MPWNTGTDDPATGLPKLPEGYYWRVQTPLTQSIGGLDERLGIALVSPTRKSIHGGALEILDTLDKRAAAVVFTGDYPPNTLND